MALPVPGFAGERVVFPGNYRNGRTDEINRSSVRWRKRQENAVFTASGRATMDRVDFPPWVPDGDDATDLFQNRAKRLKNEIIAVFRLSQIPRYERSVRF